MRQATEDEAALLEELHSVRAERNMMRDALVTISRSKHPATSTRAIGLRNIARSVLVDCFWDWAKDESTRGQTNA